MIKIFRLWELYDFNKKEGDFEMLYKRPRVDYRISEYVFEYINERILKKYNIMQNENYQIELAFYNKKTSKYASSDVEDIYYFEDGFTVMNDLEDEENLKKDINWHELISIKCCSVKLDENIKPKEYADLVYSMICAYLMRKYKKVKEELVNKIMLEMDYKPIEKYAFPALFINQKYLCDDQKNGTYKIDDIEMNIKKEYTDYYEGVTHTTFDNGDIYEGEVVNGLMHGKGKYTYAGGTVYEGDFVDGKFHGKGKQIFGDEGAYEGDYVDGNFNGKGKLTLTNGNVYEGDFVDGNFHGKGKMTYADGRVEEGSWEDGKYVKG